MNLLFVETCHGASLQLMMYWRLPFVETQCIASLSEKGYASCGDACGVFLHLLQYLVAGANAVTFAFEEDAAVAIGENHQWVIIAKC